MCRPSLTCSLAVSLACLAPAGCHRGGGSFLLNALTGAKPVSIVLVSEQLLQLNPFGPYEELRQALKDHMDRPVRLQLCAPFQCELYLSGGFCQFAFVPPTVYARLADRGRFPVLAASADLRGRRERPALLIVRSDSEIESVADLRGKVVAFGPSIDGRTCVAALDLLERNGVTRDDLKKELLPLPGSLKHIAEGRALVRSVSSGSSDAGFLDQADWERMVAGEGDDAAADVSRLRILAETKPLPDILLIASPKTAPALVETVRAFMLASGRQHPATLKPLALSGYEPVSDAALAAWMECVGGKE